MKVINSVFLSVFILLLSHTTFAQIKLFSGSFIELKGQKSFDLKFSYDSMVIGDTTSESDYLYKKKKDWNLKEPDRGKAFVTQWYEDREDLYEPDFVKHFEGFSKMRLLDQNAKYTMIVKTKRTEGGWYAGITACPSEIDGELWIVETGNESNVKAKIRFKQIKGKEMGGGDFEMTTRINSCYEIAGMEIGKYLKRKLK